MPARTSLVKRCSSCGTPLFISRELRWGSEGVIHLARAPRNRMVLYESNIIDNLFRGLEELIGIFIEHIVLESRRREVRKYIGGIFPSWMKQSLMFLNEALSGMPVFGHLACWLRQPLGKALAGRVLEVGRVYGYGDAKLGPLWEEGDVHPWRPTVVRFPTPRSSSLPNAWPR